MVLMCFITKILPIKHTYSSALAFRLRNCMKSSGRYRPKGIWTIITKSPFVFNSLCRFAKKFYILHNCTQVLLVTFLPIFQQRGTRHLVFTPTTPPIQLHRTIKISLENVPAAAKLCSSNNPIIIVTRYMALPLSSPISYPLQRLRFAATNPAVNLPAQRETHPIAATSSSEASILLINRENNSNSSNTTASPASTARIVLQIGACQQVRRTGRF